MYNFEYKKAGSVAEAASIIGADADAKLVAGGMTYIPTLKQRLAAPTTVVDMNGLGDLAGISVAGDTVTIGAMTRHAAVACSADVAAAIPALADLAGHIGDPQVRNRGTIGGSIANNDPAADYPAGLVGLGATVKTNRREVGADDFFIDMFETALEQDEIVTSVSFPKPVKAAYMKFPNPASRYAITGVFVAQAHDGVRVAVTGAGPCVFRVAAMEAALSSNWSADAVADISVSADGLNEDIHASAEYRAHLITVMAKRAVAKAG
ncbi:MAG: xanthine dehydrogenase family protein subunit M [Rhodospirillaceae bacterium]|nr:xanthine dehydrogenase family protein subunit M [Rhodospirillaceae bacterium]